MDRLKEAGEQVCSLKKPSNSLPHHTLEGSSESNLVAEREVDSRGS